MWFTNEPFIYKIFGYGYRGKLLSIKELRQHIQIDPISSILGSITTSAKINVILENFLLPNHVTAC